MANRLPQLERFLKNPNYIDNGKYGKMYLEKNQFQRRYELLSDLINDFPIHYFKENDASYYVLVTVPSERRGNTYDVVIHFFTDDQGDINSSSIRNYYMQIFSNNPVFGFHFCHANVSHGIVIPFLLDKFTPEMIKDRAQKYNPNDNVGFCQAFFHAGKYLLSTSRYLNKHYIESRAMAFRPDIISNMVRPITQTIEEYKTFKNRQAMKNKLNKEKKISDRIGDVIDEVRSKVGQGLDEVRKKVPKIGSSNYIGSGKPSVTRSKRITGKGKIKPTRKSKS